MSYFWNIFRYLKQEILAKVTFDNETTCTMWRQWAVTYCLHTLIGDNQSYEYDDDTDPALTDPSLLVDSNYESINWYPLTGLLAVPVFVGIVCFVVLRRRFVSSPLTLLSIPRLLKLKFWHGLK